MRKSKKKFTKKNKTSKKCVYTDEAKRVMKAIKYLKQHKSTKKTLKRNLNTS